MTDKPEKSVPDAPPGGAPAAQAAPEPSADAKKAAEYFDQLLRLKAEFENFRKRTDREKPQLMASGKWRLLQRFLPVYDVLLAAHKEIQAHPTAGSLATGMEMIFKEFEKIFASEGVTPIETVGQRFDAERHEALGVVERGDVEDGTVVVELQKGFLADGRVLRPAKVQISKKPAEDKK